MLTTLATSALRYSAAFSPVARRSAVSTSWRMAETASVAESKTDNDFDDFSSKVSASISRTGYVESHRAIFC